MRCRYALVALAVAHVLGSACVVECHCPDDPDASCALVADAAADAGGDPADAALPDTVEPDSTPPVIELLGSSRIDLVLGEAYTEPGYTATDAEDGDLTASLEVSGTVDTRRARTFTLTYTVADAAGNQASTIRAVVVHHSKTTVAGTYSVTESCQISGNFGPYSASITPRSGSAFTITLNNFGDFPTEADLVAELTGANRRWLDIRSQVVTGITFKGTGLWTEDGSRCVISYSANDSVDEEECTATWVKQ